MIDDLVHVAKLVALALVSGVLMAMVGGWVLSFLEPWDKDVLREPERSVDLTGRQP